MKILTIEQAITAANSGDMDALIHARVYAEHLGFESFETKEEMPSAFVEIKPLSEGFEEGLSNAECEYELIRAGWL